MRMLLIFEVIPEKPDLHTCRISTCIVKVSSTQDGKDDSNNNMCACMRKTQKP
jgi:hypothetical protein